MSEWIREWTGCDPAAERLRETQCTLGNGYFATRDALTRTWSNCPTGCSSGSVCGAPRNRLRRGTLIRSSRQPLPAISE
ncbi:hypothetical protein [Streptomyces cyanogenus]|uniref:Glycoside hydrolase family 65 N-terminal domain-containing protein n=1 Tax=Streptomyces cyanogenus TaxID=80860 RepID=A0ABX7TM55_STRCY|nr:hypothetical protein S1361_03695 [Streptomyces cyanogenus]